MPFDETGYVLIMTSSRTRVLFLIPTLTGGGAERVFVTLLRHLDRSRFQATLMVISLRDAVFRDDVPEHVDVIDLHCSRVRNAMPKIVKAIWKIRPDVVVSTVGHLNLALAMLCPLLPRNVRCIARETAVANELLKGYRLPWLWGWAYRHLYRRLDAIVCQSEGMRNDLIERFALPVRKLVLIHNPVDVEHVCRLAQAIAPAIAKDSPRSARDRPQLVAAGRLSHEKGFDLLIGALALCTKTRPHLTLLGDGPLREELEQLATQNGLSDRIHFVGFQRNPYPFFAHADALVLSSRHEGFPNVMLEALACGTPVIATPAPGGVQDIARLAGGVVLASGVHAEALSAAIDSFLDGSSRAEPIRLGAFELKAIVSQYQRLFSEAADTEKASYAV